jgi:integrase
MATKIRKKTRWPGIFEVAGKPVRYEVMYRDPGYRQRSKTFPTLKGARDFQSRVRVDPAVGKKPTKETLAQHFDYVLGNWPDLEPKYRDLIEGNWSRHIAPPLGHYPLPSITTPVVRGFMSDMEKRSWAGGSGRRTRQQVRQLLHRLLEIAIEDGKLIGGNPVVKSTSVKGGQSRPKTILTAEQVSLLANAARDAGDEGDSLLVRLLAWTGLRIGEAAALRVGDFDPFNRQLTVQRAAKEVNGRLIQGSTKTDRHRVVPLMAGLANDLAAYMKARGIAGQPDAPMFTSPTGTVLRPSTWRARVFKQAVDATRLNPRPTPHDLRHTAASLWDAAGVPTAVRQAILGHTTATMTEHYTHVVGNDLREWTDRLGETYKFTVEG